MTNTICYFAVIGIGAYTLLDVVLVLFTVLTGVCASLRDSVARPNR
jgi:hypothetical protein